MLGLFDTGLGAVRSLGRAGVPVVGLDSVPENPGFASRYCRAERCPDPIHHPGELVCFLVRLSERLDGPGILIPTSDAFTLFLARHRDSLAAHFRFNLPAPGVIEATVNKRLQYELAARVGTPIAQTYYPETLADVRQIADQLDYPAFIKPYYGHLWREHFTAEAGKGFKVGTPAEMIARFELILPTGLQAMVQSIILGPNTNHFKVCAYIDPQGALLTLFTLRKIRQYPTEFGVGTVVESVRAPELAELGWQFLRAIEYRGIGSVEFKRDDRDGKLKLIELNPRLWQQNSHATACGINFPLIQYRDLVGENPTPQFNFKTGERWFDAMADFQSFWAYYQTRQLSPLGWVRSWIGARSFATFALDDPRPFLKANGYGTKYLRAPLYALRHRKD